MFDLFAIGDIKLDTFVLLDQTTTQLRMPEDLLCLPFGAKLAVDVVDTQIAGSAPNVATGLTRLGFKTGVVSNMGVDGTRHMALAHLAEQNVSTKFIRTVKGEASSFSVVLNFKGDRTILTSHIKHAYRLPTNLPATKWIYVGEMGEGYEELYRSVEAGARKGKFKLALNPGSIQLAERRPYLYDLIKQAEVLFVNREEAQAITGELSGESAHLTPALYKLGCQHAVLTDGKNGSYHFDGKKLDFCPIYPGKMFSATGAGDAYATGFVAAIMNDLGHEDAMRWGSVNAASVITKVGPTAGLLTEAQIRAHLRRTPKFAVEQR